MTTTTLTINADGTSTSTSQGVVRCTDYDQPGVSVQDGAGSRIVTASDQLRGDELINIDGLGMTVTQARELGLLNKVFDEGLSVGAATQAASQHREATKPSTGHDATASDIIERVEAGDISEEEGFEYDLTAATIAGADMTVTEVVDLIDGLNDGTLTAMDVDANQRHIAQNVEKRVTDAATKSAMNELGPQGFDRLVQLAAASPVVDGAIRQYASMRALGRSTDSWSDFLSMAEDEMTGRA